MTRNAEARQIVSGSRAARNDLAGNRLSRAMSCYRQSGSPLVRQGATGLLMRAASRSNRWAARTGRSVPHVARSALDPDVPRTKDRGGEALTEPTWM